MHKPLSTRKYFLINYYPSLYKYSSIITKLFLFSGRRDTRGNKNLQNSFNQQLHVREIYGHFTSNLSLIRLYIFESLMPKIKHLISDVECGVRSATSRQRMKRLGLDSRELKSTFIYLRANIARSNHTSPQFIICKLC